MKNILVYDIDAEELDRIADTNNTTIAEIVCMLVDYAEEMRIDNKLN